MTHPRTRCVHCLRPLEKKTKDHAPPKMWYPRNAAPQRPTAPSCGSCNHDLGELEHSVMQRVVLAIDPDHPAVADVSARVLRGLTPSDAGDPGEARARTAERGRLRAMIGYVSTGTAGAVLPNFEGPPGGPRMVIAPPELVVIGDKMVRVLLHYRRRRYIESTDAVRVAFKVPDTVLGTFNRLPPSAMWLKIEHAPGMLSLAFDCEDGTCMWAFRFWGRLNLVACSGPSELVRRLFPKWGEAGGRRHIRLEFPASAYAAEGVTPPPRRR